MVLIKGYFFYNVFNNEITEWPNSTLGTHMRVIPCQTSIWCNWNSGNKFGNRYLFCAFDKNLGPCFNYRDIRLKQVFFSQWQGSFYLKLCCHWPKGLWQRQFTLKNGRRFSGLRKIIESISPETETLNIHFNTCLTTIKRQTSQRCRLG